MTENRLTYLALDLPPTLFSSVLAPFRSIIVILFVDLVVISLPFIRLQIPGKVVHHEPLVPHIMLSH